MDVYWRLHIGRLMKPSVGCHERADNNGDSIEFERCDGEALSGPSNALDQVTHLKRCDNLGEGILFRFVPYLFTCYGGVFDDFVDDQLM